MGREGVFELRWAINRRWSLWKWDIDEPVLQYRVYEVGRVPDNSDGWTPWRPVPIAYLQDGKEEFPW